MPHILENSDTELLLEYLDKIYASPTDNTTLKEALKSLKEMIENTEGSSHNGDNQENVRSQLDESQARIMAMKQFIFSTKPDLLEHLLKFTDDQSDDVEYILEAKAELLAEAMKGYPPLKTSVMPLIDQLLVSLFRDNVDNNPTHHARAFIARYPIAALLYPDPETQDAHVVALKALAAQIKSFSDILAPELRASKVDESLRREQEALIYGLRNVAATPLDPDAVMPFIESGALDALLTVIARGPLSPMGAPITLNSSLDDACRTLYELMNSAKPEVLAQALNNRQAVGSLLRNMTYICHHNDLIWATDIPHSLVNISKSSDVLLQQIVAEARSMVRADPNKLGPGAPIVLWKLLDSATGNDIDDLEKVSKSNEYVPFFLAAIKPGASDKVLDAVGEALEARIGQPGKQLRKGISTPEQVEKITQLVEYACTQSAPDISPAMHVLRELILPSSEEYTGGWIDPEEELRRANKQFWVTFSQAIKTRIDAACALGPEITGQEASDIAEPSEVGLAHMKNVQLLTQLVEEQYTTMALLLILPKYLQTLLLNSSPLSRCAGLELLTAMTKDSSLKMDFSFVPDLIEGFKLAVAYLLSDPRKLIRAMALDWLNRITGYRHPEAEDFSRYKPGIDFVLEVVTEDILVEALKGTSDEVGVVAEIIQSMISRSVGTEISDRLKRNRDLVEALWNGVFWDEDKARAPQSEDQDISEGVSLSGNVKSSSASALSALLDPLADLDSIVEHIAPHMAELSGKDWLEFHSTMEVFPEVASVAILKPKSQVLSITAEMTTQIEQLPFAMQVLRKLSQGTILAKVHIGQSDEVYAALVKILQDNDESAKSPVLFDLDNMLYASSVSKFRFMKEGGIKALLDIVVSDTDSTHTQYALSALEHLLENFPEGVKTAIDAGAVPILESKCDPDGLPDSAWAALKIIESQKDAPLIDRIEFTPDAYAELGKKLPDPAVLERLTENFESSMDEKQLGIAAGLTPVLTDLLRSSSDPKPALKALKALLVIDGEGWQGWQGFNVVKRTGQQCGLPELLKPLIESDDEEIQALAEAVKNAIVQGCEDEFEESGNEDNDGNVEVGEQEAWNEDEDTIDLSSDTTA
ncbi:hypothetical protein OPQ81_010235 [Rhizoctonia solani]|nr:hypothetical protein OPQ81_010235 [Rhizoctonia solani]